MQEGSFEILYHAIVVDSAMKSHVAIIEQFIFSLTTKKILHG